MGQVCFPLYSACLVHSSYSLTPNQTFSRKKCEENRLLRAGVRRGESLLEVPHRDRIQSTGFPETLEGVPTVLVLSLNGRSSVIGYCVSALGTEYTLHRGQHKRVVGKLLCDALSALHPRDPPVSHEQTSGKSCCR